MSFEDALDFICQQKESTDPYVLVFKGLDNLSIRTIRRQYQLHPVLDSECSNLWYNDKDSLLLFEDYFLLTMNDADMSNNLETPVSLKMIVFRNLMIIFATDELFCIRQVFKNDLHFSEFPSNHIKKYAEVDIPKWSSKIKVGIEEEKGCSKLESVFHKILEAIYSRLEETILEMNENAKICFDECELREVEDSIEFVTKLAMSKEKLIYLEEVIGPKSRLFRDLLDCNFFSDYIKYYLRSLESRTVILVEQIKNNKVLIKTAERTYSESKDNILVTNSKKLNTTTRYFSSISTIFLPINLVAGLWGMNVQVPFEFEPSLIPFYVIIFSSLTFFISCVVFFKRKGWM